MRAALVQCVCALVLLAVAVSAEPCVPRFGQLIVDQGSTCTLSGKTSYVFERVHVAGTLRIEGDNATLGAYVIQVTNTGTIDATGQGMPSDVIYSHCPRGAPGSGASSGGYGSGSGAAPPCGIDPFMPRGSGPGGASSSSGALGGNGGGFLLLHNDVAMPRNLTAWAAVPHNLEAEGTMIDINGTIRVNGASGASGAGAGAGGNLVIYANLLRGVGAVLQANGGSGSGGGGSGSGGRIEIRTQETQRWQGTVQACGGGFSAGAYGGPGTAYWNETMRKTLPNGTELVTYRERLVVNGCGRGSNAMPTSFFTLDDELNSQLINEIPYVSLTNGARLAASRLLNADGSPAPRAALVVHALGGDGSGTLVADSGTDLIILGPADDDTFVTYTPTLSQFAWKDSDIRVARIDRIYHTQLMDLKAHVEVAEDASIALPRKVRAVGQTLQVRGNLTGAAWLELEGGSALHLHGTGRTTNATSEGEYSFDKVELQNSQITLYTDVRNFTVAGDVRMVSSSRITASYGSGLHAGGDWYMASSSHVAMKPSGNRGFSVGGHLTAMSSCSLVMSADGYGAFTVAGDVSFSASSTMTLHRRTVVAIGGAATFDSHADVSLTDCGPTSVGGDMSFNSRADLSVLRLESLEVGGSLTFSDVARFSISTLAQHLLVGGDMVLGHDCDTAITGGSMVAVGGNLLVNSHTSWQWTSIDNGGVGATMTVGNDLEVTQSSSFTLHPGLDSLHIVGDARVLSSSSMTLNRQESILIERTLTAHSSSWSASSIASISLGIDLLFTASSMSLPATSAFHVAGVVMFQSNSDMSITDCADFHVEGDADFSGSGSTMVVNNLQGPFRVDGDLRFRTAARFYLQNHPLTRRLVLDVGTFEVHASSRADWHGHVTINTRLEFLISASGSMVGSGRGYNQNEAPEGCNTAGSPSVGASFGGFGSASNYQGGTLRQPCGSYEWPSVMGPGGSGHGGAVGGRGGGGLVVVCNATVFCTVTIDGHLEMNGGGATSGRWDWAAGGGAGGAFAVSTRIMAGSGVVQANGGAGQRPGWTPQGGGGSGGRIAVIAVTNEWSGSMTACGGWGATGYGGPGTMLYTVGSSSLTATRTLVVDNCGQDGVAQLAEPDRLLYELDYVNVLRRAQLGIAPPSDTPGSRASLVVKALQGDSTGKVTAMPRTNILLLGPISDSPAMYPIVTELAYENSFARVERQERVYYPTSLHLNMAGIHVHADAKITLPKRVFMEDIDCIVSGVLGGVEELVVGNGVTLRLDASGNTYNATGGAGEYTFERLELTGSAAVTAANVHTLRSHTLLQIQDSARLTFSGSTPVWLTAKALNLVNTASLYFGGSLVTLEAIDTLTLAAGTVVNGDFGGYTANQVAPGCPADGTAGAGASHGGYGGVSQQGGSQRTPCGSYTWPSALGSGGLTWGPGVGGAGGGAITLVCNATLDSVLRLDGLITVNGQNAYSGNWNGAGGGGAGGSVAIDARTLNGTGVVRALGGHGQAPGWTPRGGGGSGGRIAVHSSISGFEGSVSACGGYYSASAGGTYGHGSPGTVFFSLGKNRALRERTLDIDNCNVAASSASLNDPGRELYEFESITLRRQGALSVAKPSNSAGARAVLALKAVYGDRSAWLDALPGTDIVILGPIENALAMVPKVHTTAWENSFGRATTTFRVYFPTSLALDMANIRVRNGGTVVLPKNLHIEHVELQVEGTLAGVDNMTIGEGGVVSFKSTGHTTNVTAGTYNFKELYAVSTASLTASSITTLQSETIISFQDSSTFAIEEMNDGVVKAQELMLRDTAAMSLSGLVTLDIRDAMVLEKGASINGNGGGYSANQVPPGCTSDGQAGVGGSFGGQGGRSQGYAVMNSACGDFAWPHSRGSGGKTWGPGIGGRGGAGLTIIANATLTSTLIVDGTVRLNGANAQSGNWNGAGGGGAGGGFTVDARLMNGTGSIELKGGHGQAPGWTPVGGGGSGGRAAFHLSINAFSGSVLACGGYYASSSAASGIGHGAAGTVFWSTGTFRPSRTAVMTVDNCNINAAGAAWLQGRSMYQFESINLVRQGKLTAMAMPAAASAVVIKAVQGDGSGWMVMPSDVSLQLLGPVADSATYQPTVTAVDTDSSFRRSLRVESTFYPTSLRLDMVNLNIKAGATLLLPKNLHIVDRQLLVAGRILGVDSLRIGGTAAVTLQASGATSAPADASGTWEFVDLVVDTNGQLTVESPKVLATDTWLRLVDSARLSVTQGSVSTRLTAPTVELLDQSRLNFQGFLTVDAHDRLLITADARLTGQGGGLTTGQYEVGCPAPKGSDHGTGGSHSGRGGRSQGSTNSREPCGVHDFPFLRGAAGATWGPFTGANGGGALRLVANATLDTEAIINGTIDVRGADAGNGDWRGGPGGGAGGSLLVFARMLQGFGVFDATGGSGAANGWGYHGGGGSAGRVAFHVSVNEWQGSVQNCGGLYAKSAGGSTGHGAGGTTFWSVGTFVPTRHATLSISNCNLQGAYSATLNNYANYSFAEVTLAKAGELTVSPRQDDASARLTLLIKVLHGDRTGSLNIAPTLDLMLLGPVEDSLSMSPARSAYAWADSFARTLRQEEVFYPTSFSLDMVNLDVADGGKLVLPSFVVVRHVQLHMRGELHGVDNLVAATGASLTWYNTARQGNATRPNVWAFDSLRIIEDATWTAHNMFGLHSDSKIEVSGSATFSLNNGQSESHVTARELVLNGTATLAFTGTMRLETVEQVWLGPSTSIDGSGGGWPVATNIPGCEHPTYLHGGGGGHGGWGGASANGAHRRLPCGDFEFPEEMGGGGFSWSVAGGAGGAALIMTVNDTLTSTASLYGQILLRGANGVSHAYSGGGGAGGSFWLDAKLLRGGGLIDVSGGTGSTRAGGGAGGRIAIHTSSKQHWSGSVSACPGRGWSNSDGGAGTIFWSVGEYRPARVRDLLVDACGAYSHPDIRSHLYNPGRRQYKLSSLVLANNARLSWEPPAVEGRAGLLLQQLAGDGSTWLHVNDRTDLQVLGPITNASAMVPVVVTTAWSDTFARGTSRHEMYYVRSYALNTVNVAVATEGRFTVPDNLLVDDGMQLLVDGELAGVTTLTLDHGAKVVFSATARQMNRTHGDYAFHRLSVYHDSQLRLEGTTTSLAVATDIVFGHASTLYAADFDEALVTADRFYFNDTTTVSFTGLVMFEAATYFSLALDATIDGSAGGYLPGARLPDCVGPTGGAGAGGSYGGYGGRSTNNAVLMQPCGSYEYAWAMGAGGIAWSGTGGRGGSGIALVANNTFTSTLQLDGTVLMNGGYGTGHSGGGAGGGIMLDARVLRGRGTLTANGGYSASNGGGGSGGRISVAASKASWTGMTTACGGSGYGSAREYHGGPGTKLFSIGELRSDRVQELFIDNCDHMGQAAHLYPPRLKYEVDRAYITGTGRLSVEPPAVTGQSVLLLKQLTGDGTGWVDVVDRTQLLVLGPIEDNPVKVPVVAASHWNNTFARGVTVSEMYYVLSYALDEVNVLVHTEGKFASPNNLVVNAMQLVVYGELMGVTRLTASNGAQVTLHPSAYQTNRTAGDYDFEEVRVVGASRLDVHSPDLVRASRLIEVSDTSVVKLHDCDDTWVRMSTLALNQSSQFIFTGLLTLDVADYMMVDQAATISGAGGGLANNQRMPACPPPTTSSSSGSGGSHGGQGSRSSSYATLSPACGDYEYPYDMGAGGVDWSGAGGAGGGGLRLLANRTLDTLVQLDGTIDVSGVRGTGHGGGGAGGGLFIQVRHLRGGGTLQAHGGPSSTNGGGGSGGRIGVHIAYSAWHGSTLACGGTGWRAGGAGTVYYAVGPYKPTRSRVLTIDNCGVNSLDNAAWLTTPGRSHYEFEKVFITRNGRLTASPPNLVADDRASLLAKQIGGDQTGTIAAVDRIDLLMFGPISNAPPIVPTLRSVAFDDSFARVQRQDRVFYMRSLHLNVVNVDVLAGGTLALAETVVVEGVYLHCDGEMAGAKNVVVAQGGSVVLRANGRTANETVAGAYSFAMLRTTGNGVVRTEGAGMLRVTQDLDVVDESSLQLQGGSSDPVPANLLQVDGRMVVDNVAQVTVAGDWTFNVHYTMEVASGASIVGVGSGYAANDYSDDCPISGSLTGNVGGTGGGFGGASASSNLQAPCNRYEWPRLMGAGGRHGSAGKGGAALALLVNATLKSKLIIDGTVDVSGAVGYAGGGGGSIAIAAQLLEGSGSLVANGGASNRGGYGGGGGGSIALLASEANYTGSAHACGALGDGVTGGNKYNYGGGSGTVYWAVGAINHTACPVFSRRLVLDNCGVLAPRTAHLADPGRTVYDLSEVLLLRGGGLSVARPDFSDTTSTATVTLRSLKGDRTGRLHVQAGISMLVLGPADESQRTVPNHVTTAWRNSLARVVASYQVFYPESLDMAMHVVVDNHGTLTLPPRVVSQATNWELAGELSGVDQLLVEGGSVKLYATGRTSNTSEAAMFHFDEFTLTNTPLTTWDLRELKVSSLTTPLRLQGVAFTLHTPHEDAVVSGHRVEFVQGTVVVVPSWPGQFRIVAPGAFTLDGSSSIDATGVGWAEGTADPECTVHNYQGSGGALGGAGSRSAGSGGMQPPCGSAEYPFLRGAGGSRHGNSPGGRGGGAVAIESRGMVTLDGSITVNGLQSSNGWGSGYTTHQGGSGSGGSIVVSGAEVRGTGSLNGVGANGRQHYHYYRGQRYSYGGGGSGGRVALHARDSLEQWQGSISLCGGSSQYGYAGTGTAMLVTGGSLFTTTPQQADAGASSDLSWDFETLAEGSATAFADWDSMYANGYQRAAGGGVGGSDALQLTTATASEWAGARAEFELVPLKPTGTRLVLSGSVKVDSSITGNVPPTMLLQIEFADGSWEVVMNATLPTAATGGWQPLALAAVMPKPARRGVLSVSLGGGAVGSLMVDDLALEVTLVGETPRRRKLIVDGCSRANTATAAGVLLSYYEEHYPMENVTVFDELQVLRGGRVRFYPRPAPAVRSMVHVEALTGDQSSGATVQLDSPITLSLGDNRDPEARVPRWENTNTHVQFVSETERRYHTTTTVAVSEARIDQVSMAVNSGGELVLPHNLHYGTAVSISNSGLIRGVVNATRALPGRVAGCMINETAINYSPHATEDDGSCWVDSDEFVMGCTYPFASNYQPNATINDGNCTLPRGLSLGCTCPSAANYNPAAEFDDGTCIDAHRDAVRGCTYPSAPNYNPAATVDDGSCALRKVGEELASARGLLDVAEVRMANLTADIACMEDRVEVAMAEHAIMEGLVRQCDNTTAFAVWRESLRCSAEAQLFEAGCQARLGNLSTLLWAAEEERSIALLAVDAERNNTAYQLELAAWQCEQTRAVDATVAAAVLAECQVEVGTAEQDRDEMFKNWQDEVNNTAVAVAARGRQCDQQRALDDMECESEKAVVANSLGACRTDKDIMYANWQNEINNTAVAVRIRGEECERERSVDLQTCNTRVAGVASDLGACNEAKAILYGLWQDEINNTAVAVAARGAECEQQRDLDASLCTASKVKLQNDLDASLVERDILHALWQDEINNTEVAVRQRGDECEQQRAVDKAACDSELTVCRGETQAAEEERDTMRGLWEAEKENTAIAIADTWVACNNEREVERNQFNSRIFFLETELDSKIADINALRFEVDECRNDTAIAVAKSVAQSEAVSAARAAQEAAEVKAELAHSNAEVWERQLEAADAHISHLEDRVAKLMAALKAAQTDLLGRAAAAAAGAGAGTSERRLTSTAAAAAYAECGEACQDVTAGDECTAHSECLSGDCNSTYPDWTCDEWWFDCLVDHSGDAFWDLPPVRTNVTAWNQTVQTESRYPVMCDMAAATPVCLQRGVCNAATCGDGLVNQGEGDVDCGGPCNPCEDAMQCHEDRDCISNHCAPDVNGTRWCVSATCSDGILNQGEADVDCGDAAGLCQPCANGKQCREVPGTTVQVQCASGICLDGVCSAPSCRDGLTNAQETCIDAGGPDCVARCAIGAGCAVDGDCGDIGRCTGGVCQAPTCSDGLLNQGETQVDCGGPACAQTCVMGDVCSIDGDCWSDYCDSSTGRCGPPRGCSNGVADCWRGVCETGVDCGQVTDCGLCPPLQGCDSAADCSEGVCDATSGLCSVPDCFDGIMNGAEVCTDGGATCLRGCPDFNTCTTSGDCASRRCVSGACAPATCTDHTRNANETGVDCGFASACKLCSAGATCGSGIDCTSGVCVYGLCQKPNAADGVRNGAETDVDCGGGVATTPRCPLGRTCAANSDCSSQSCEGGVCILTDLCANGIVDGQESDVDCGGACDACSTGSSCSSHQDCEERVCANNVCIAPTCSDGVANGDEMGVDCGGPVCAACGAGSACQLDRDCETGACVSGVCAFADTCSNGQHDVPPAGSGALLVDFESDVDCGGSCGGTCEENQMCFSTADCGVDLVCVTGKCLQPNCADLVLSGDEADVDCGGSCPKCGGWRRCRGNGDCTSDLCQDGFCVVPADVCAVAPAAGQPLPAGAVLGADGLPCGGVCDPCPAETACQFGIECESLRCDNATCTERSCSDGVRNGKETGIDCGGPASGCGLCGSNAWCFSDDECASASCVDFRCATGASCTNRIRDGAESDIDCGGNCFSCPLGSSCGIDDDCELGAFCLFGTCTAHHQLFTSALVASATEQDVSSSTFLEGSCDGAVVAETEPQVTGLARRRGPSGPGQIVTVVGKDFISIGSASFRCVGSPAGGSGGSGGSGPVAEVASCRVITNTELRCDAPPTIGSAVLRFQYRKHSWVSTRGWRDAVHSSSTPGWSIDRAMTFHFTHVHGAVVAMRVLRTPPFGIAGRDLPIVPTVELLDGTGRRLGADFSTLVTLSLSHATSTSTSGSSGGNGRRLLGSRALQSSNPGSSSGGGSGSGSTPVTGSGNDGGGTFTVRAIGGVVEFHNLTLDDTVGGDGFAFDFAVPGIPGIKCSSGVVSVFQPSDELCEEPDFVSDVAGVCCDAMELDRCGVCFGRNVSCGASTSLRLKLGEDPATADWSLLAADAARATGLPVGRVKVEWVQVLTNSSESGQWEVEAHVALLPVNTSSPATSGGGSAWEASNLLFDAVFDPESILWSGNMTKGLVVPPGPSFVARAACGNGVCEIGEHAGDGCGDCEDVEGPVGSKGAPLAKPCTGKGTGGGGFLPYIHMLPSNSSGERLPAIVASGTAAFSTLGVFTHMAMTVPLGIRNNWVTASGAAFGGVGFGPAAVDLGVSALLDTAQFVTLSTQLNATATPWVVRYFVEYFEPFIGLLPLPFDVQQATGDELHGEAAAMAASDAARAQAVAEGKSSKEQDEAAALAYAAVVARGPNAQGYMPRGMSVLYQSGMWGDTYGPHNLFGTASVESVVYAVVATVIAVAAARKCAPSRGTRVRRTPSKDKMVRGHHMHGSGGCCLGTPAWIAGQVVSLWSHLFYLLCLSVFYELWASQGAFSASGVPMAWVALVAILATPLAAATIGVAAAKDEHQSVLAPFSWTDLVFGGLYRHFKHSYRVYGILTLLDRAASAAVVVAAAGRPTLQLVLLLSKALLWLALLVHHRPYVSASLQQFAVLAAVYKALVLGLSVAFIPNAASDNADHIEIVGWVVALLHVSFFLFCGILVLIKVFRTFNSDARQDMARRELMLVRKRTVQLQPGEGAASAAGLKRTVVDPSGKSVDGDEAGAKSIRSMKRPAWGGRMSVMHNPMVAGAEPGADGDGASAGSGQLTGSAANAALGGQRSAHTRSARGRGGRGRGRGRGRARGGMRGRAAGAQRVAGKPASSNGKAEASEPRAAESTPASPGQVAHAAKKLGLKRRASVKHTFSPVLNETIGAGGAAGAGAGGRAGRGGRGDRGGGRGGGRGRGQ